jgi:hypothetical protein
MTPELFIEQAKTLLKTVGFCGEIEIIPIDGGGNNRVYLTRQDNRIIGVIKQYYHAKENLRDRLSSEYSFSKFLWDHNVHQIPMPIACDPLTHLAFFNYIDGRKITSEEMTKNHIDQAIGFFHAINLFRTSDSANGLQDAAEACFSLAGHINLTEKRIMNLKNFAGSSPTDKKAQKFIQHELIPAWEIIRENAVKMANVSNIVPRELIPTINKRLSPSDFGFHNALIDKKGTLYFMDFEYAGWDDPTKMICDFFCQPAIPVPEHFFPYIIEKVVSGMDDAEIQRQRIEMLLPVYQIKWCCIVMNEFLPRGTSRRKFMENISEPESKKEEQLLKARNIIRKVSQDL